MGRHTGERAPGTARKPQRGRIVLLSALVLATLVAWGVLVRAAIDFGRAARSGTSEAWTFLGVASAGAAACLLVTLVLTVRLYGVVRGRSAPPPARLPGGRRRAVR